MKTEIRNCLTFLANQVAETVLYQPHWSMDFCHQEITKAYKKVAEELKKHLDWNNLTEEDCQELRFGKWEKESQLYLIPIWLYSAIPIGTKLTSIFGEEIVFDGSNIDKDNRFGCLAYGIIPKQKAE